MEGLIQSDKIYIYCEYPSEKEFEQVIVDNSFQIFGTHHENQPTELEDK